MSHLSEQEVFAKTLYAEARGESKEGQEWVSWVIKNRAGMNRGYWGGDSIKKVCLQSGQFECWTGKSDIAIKDSKAYESCKQIADRVYNSPSRNDPTGGADHYNNPDKEGYPAWTRNCKIIKQIGGHVFYKGP